jgi:hypothetical protein
VSTAVEGQVEADLAALLPLLGLHEHPVADDDELLAIGGHSGKLCSRTTFSGRWWPEPRSIVREVNVGHRFS